MQKQNAVIDQTLTQEEMIEAAKIFQKFYLGTFITSEQEPTKDKKEKGDE